MPTSQTSKAFDRQPSPDLEAIYSENILEEIQHFSQEIKAHKKFLADLDSNVGTTEDKKMLYARTAKALQFLVDVKSSIKDLNLDVHNVNMQVHEQLAVCERARIKAESDRDPEYLR